jgi:hypothetical protein
VKALNRLMTDQAMQLVILEAAELDLLAQFLKVGDHSLMLDLPTHNLDDEMHARAVRLFADAGKSIPTRSGTGGFLQREFEGRGPGLEEATRFAVFDQVFQLAPTAEVRVSFGGC